MGYTTNFAGRLSFDKELTNEQTETINNFNEERHEPTVNQDYPGYWCQWAIVDGHLEWDGGEKFYDYVEWLQYLIKNYFDSWGVKLNGQIKWFGEENDDMGIIEVTDSKVKVLTADIRFVEDQ